MYSMVMTDSPHDWATLFVLEPYSICSNRVGKQLIGDICCDLTVSWIHHFYDFYIS